MPKAPITPIDTEIEAELAKQKRNEREGEPNQSADQQVPGSDEIPKGNDGGAQRQPS